MSGPQKKRTVGTRAGDWIMRYAPEQLTSFQIGNQVSFRTTLEKWQNLKAAYAIWFAFYNFCRVHKTLRATPAMEAGLTDHVWELAALLS